MVCWCSKRFVVLEYVLVKYGRIAGNEKRIHEADFKFINNKTQFVISRSYSTCTNTNEIYLPMVSTKFSGKTCNDFSGLHPT